MDEELRELESMAQKTVNMGSKEEMLQAILNATGKVLGVAAKPVKKANDIEKERHIQKKAQKAEQKQTVSERFGKKNLENFYFTGKETDLCYFLNTDKMPASAFNNIPDPELRDKVYDALDLMCSKKKGLIKIDGDGVVITEKGKKLSNDKNFREKALNDQVEAYGKHFENMFGQAPEGQEMLGVGLNSDGVHDFAFFNHSDTMNLNQILANPNGKLREQIVENIKQWQQNGLVTIKDGFAKVTDKGKELLKANAEAFKKASKDMTEKAVDGLKHTADSVMVTTKKAVKKAAEKTAEAAKTATKTVAKAMKFIK